MAADRARSGPGFDQDELLEGWKAIADHLDKTERTVQRWEKTKGLPVRRLKSGSPEEQSRVLAYKSELDAWWQERLTRPDDDESNLNLDPGPDRKGRSVIDAVTDQDRHKPSAAPSFWVAVALGVVLIAVGVRVFLPDILKKLKPLPARITLAVRPSDIMRSAFSAFAWIGISILVSELLGYLLHRLMHSGKITFLSRSHMRHHLLLYGPLDPQRPGSEYRDATTGMLVWSGSSPARRSSPAPFCSCIFCM
jgi:hypothetical protein